MIRGTVFNIQRFSTDDGGGIRTCVFLKGCPLRCAWCHNAEGLSFSPETAFFERSCIGCGTCLTACKQGALSLSNGRLAIERAKCVTCGRCAEVCPSNAMVMIGKKKTVDEVMALVRRDRIFYGQNGGLTITGGEPLGQAKFTHALAQAAKAEGITVAVETSGYGKTEDVLALAPYCDHFLFDCKASSEDHESFTGVTDELIVKNLSALCEVGARITLRCPAVQGANLRESFLKKIINLSKNKDAIKEIQLMPYHPTGLEKTASLGKGPQKRYETPNEELLTRLAKEIEAESGKHCFF